MRKLLSFLLLLSVLNLSACNGEISIDDEDVNKEETEISVVEYAVEYVDYDGTILQTEGFESGSDLSGVTPPNDPRRDGYTFNGWDTVIPPEIGTDKITLNATYIANEYSIVFNANNGEGTMETQVITFSEESTLNTNTFTKEGYIFEGWNSSVDGSGLSYSNEENFTMDMMGLQLYAQWTANTYTITLEVNDGTNAENTTFEVAFDQTITLPTPTLVGDIPFNGWYIGDELFTDEGGTLLHPFKYTSDITLTAVYYIEILSSSDLIGVSSNLSANYKLMNDIDISDLEWTPIGNVENQFNGIFDGQNYTISGLTITSNYDYVGLFGYSIGVIKNIVLDNVSIDVTGDVEQIIFSGGLLGYNEGHIENITTLTGRIYLKVRGDIEGYVGGIVGYNYSTDSFSNLTNDLEVVGDLVEATGGIIGYSDNPITLNQCSNSGTVNGTSSATGGIVGYGRLDIYINSSYNTGEIIGQGSVGGLVGRGKSKTYMTLSYNSGDILGTSTRIGGLVGNSGSTISDSYNSGNISGESLVGGLVGNCSSSSDFTNTSNSGTINSNGIAGGLIGLGHATVIDSHNSGIIYGQSATGGIIGEGWSVTIINSYNTAQINGYDRVGGLVGYYEIFYNIEISKSYNTGEVIGNDDVGGLIGYGRESLKASIKNSYNNGTITGNMRVGGLAGRVIDMVISNSYNSGIINGNNLVGGIAGGPSGDLYFYSIVSYGDVNCESENSSQVGEITAYSFVLTDYDSIYTTGVLYINNVIVEGNQIGTKVSDLSLFTVEFFTDTLLWDETIWDFENIDINNDVFPTLN